jgi:hypothetical protein
MTLEAYADTFVPGEKRTPDDQAVAGAAPGPGAVEAGALDLLMTPATGVTEGLEDLARSLNTHAQAYATGHELELDPSVPPFVALAFEQRRDLVRELTTPGHPEKEIWVLVGLFCFMAFDTAPHIDTTYAISIGHPGLTAMGFAAPDADGLWRFADYSYSRPLASIHPNTTVLGDPA